MSRVSVNDESRRSALPSTRDARRLEILNETIQSSLLLPARFAAYPAVEAAVWPILLQAVTAELAVSEALSLAGRKMNAIIVGSDTSH